MKGHIQMLSDLLKATELAGERRNKVRAQMVRPINVCVVQTSSRGENVILFLVRCLRLLSLFSKYVFFSRMVLFQNAHIAEESGYMPHWQIP